MKKWVAISIFITVPMFVEDFVLFLIGRHTTIPMWGVVLGILILGFATGAFFRMRKTKQFLGE